MKVRVTNIQRFCLNDGPGIRTTVFLKGCNLKCPWCANPENMKYEKQKYIKNEEIGIYGMDMDILELFDEIIKDKEYYSKSGGGVTFSGGEALLQAKSLEPLLNKLKENNINVCFETALMVQMELLELIISYVDRFIVDIKILDEDKIKDVLYGNINLYYNNLDLLFKGGKSVTFRIPLVKGYTLDSYNIDKIIELLKKYKGSKVEIFKIHNLAESKYKSLGIEMKKFDEISDEEVEIIYDKLLNEGIDVEVIKI